MTTRATLTLTLCPAILVAPALGSGGIAGIQLIDDQVPGLAPLLDDYDEFGASVTRIGDLNGDGVADLVVGAPGDDDESSGAGALWVLFLQSDGSVGATHKILPSHLTIYSSPSHGVSSFGTEVTRLGDIDDDGVVDLAVGGHTLPSLGTTSEQAVNVLLLNTDGTVKDSTYIHYSFQTHAPGFGTSLTGPGDIDGDGYEDLVVGFPDDGSSRPRAAPCRSISSTAAARCWTPK